MPTSLPPRHSPPEGDPRGTRNLAAFALSLALLAMSLWLLNALADANAKLACLESGRTHCDEKFYR